MKTRYYVRVKRFSFKYNKAVPVTEPYIFDDKIMALIMYKEEKLKPNHFVEFGIVTNKGNRKKYLTQQTRYNSFELKKLHMNTLTKRMR